MDKPFEVKEFDTIICNEDYKDDEKYKYLNQKRIEFAKTLLQDPGVSGTEVAVK